MNDSEAAGDLVSIQTSLFLSCKSCCCDTNKPAFTKVKQRGLYQNKVTGSLASSHKPGNSATTVKWSTEPQMTMCERTAQTISFEWLHFYPQTLTLLGLRIKLM